MSDALENSVDGEGVGATEPIVGNGVTRTTQTKLILGAIVVVAIFFAWLLWPAPNLDGVNSYDRCAYYSWARTHGGSKLKCEEQAAAEARDRLMRGF